MTPAIRCCSFAFCLAVLSAVSALAQTTETAAVPVAYVYVQTTPGVMAFAVAANGKLTPVVGSPFKVSGQMEDISGKLLVSVGETYLHTYSIKANGAIGSQLSQTNTASYGGSECGGTSGHGSALDHSGEYLYVQLDSNSDCSAWQSYRVTSEGLLQFLGDVDSYDYLPPDGPYAASTVPTVSSNDKFLYGTFPNYDYNENPVPYFAAFKKASNGELAANGSFSHTDPAPYHSDGSYFYYYPTLVQADPSGHLAAIMTATSDSSFLKYLQLASYTIDASTGGIKSTNTGKDMPSLATTNQYINPPHMEMSPSGKLLAVAEYPGLEIFHFNGAAPLTALSGLLLPKVDFDQVEWDNDNHLYALSYESSQLHVFTATPDSITEVTGSPYHLPSSPYGTKGLIVIK